MGVGRKHQKIKIGVYPVAGCQQLQILPVFDVTKIRLDPIGYEMKTIINTARGTASETLAFVDREQPKPGAGQVLVKIHASGVNPSDAKVRIGAQGPLPAEEVIPHNDGAGVIEVVGEGVSRRRIGEPVWLYNVNRTPDGQGQGCIGTAAEYVAVDADLAAPLPHGVSFEEGACLGVPAMTAHRAVFAGGDVAGKTLLITGGAGSVGLMAVQMAVAAGARVITTISSAEKATITAQAGAEIILNYRNENLLERLLAEVGENAIDRLIDVDFAAHAALTPRILTRGGTIATYASGSDMTPAIPFVPLMFNNTVLEMVFVYGMPASAKKQAIEDINHYLRSGAIRPMIAAQFPLAEAVKAHEAIEAGNLTGNVVLQV